MDRREALKKMAAGGATVVGASTILSNVAFANGGTPGCAPTGSVSLSYSSTGTTVTIGASPTVSCPCGSSQPDVTYQWTGGAASNGSVVISTPNGTTYPAAYPWSLTVTVECLDASGDPVCASYSTSGTVTKTANGNNYTFAPASPPSGSLTSGSC
jgi:hypothetical protein